MYWSRLIVIAWLLLFYVSPIEVTCKHLDTATAVGSINTSDRTTIHASSSSSSTSSNTVTTGGGGVVVVDPLCIDSQQYFITDLSPNTGVDSQHHFITDSLIPPAAVPPPPLIDIEIPHSLSDHLLLFVLIVLLSIALGVVIGLTAHSMVWPHHHHSNSNIQHSKKDRRGGAPGHSSSSSRHSTAGSIAAGTDTCISMSMIEDELYIADDDATHSRKETEEVSGKQKPSSSSSSSSTSSYYNNDDDNDDNNVLLMSKPSRIPRHIAVIMDGNRRFGKEMHSDPLQVW
jgi:hypothetical protein